MRCFPIHPNIWFHLGQACFAVNLSRYESRLSPSIKRRPRLLPGQVTTTLEINPASISLYVIALLNGISSTCNHRRRPLRFFSENNCERIAPSIKQKRFRSLAAKKEANMCGRDPSCADMSCAFCTKYPILEPILGQMIF
jgi:hypothetical protein